MLEVIDGRDQSTPVHISRPRAVAGDAGAEQAAAAIVRDVRLRGDDALIDYTRRFDGVELTRERLPVDRSIISKARASARPELIDALEVMVERLRATCERQRVETWLERRDDELVGELIRPLARVGVYAPGGRAAYASTVVMAVVPAQVAGVEGIAVATPPGGDGQVASPILVACSVLGISEVYGVGGAQAIAALAYGTETIRPVDKVVGPGNVYVTFAKRAVQGWVGTDSEAGPTEIAIVADDGADPVVVASDLVAQAEHGPNGTHALITWSPELAQAVMEAIELIVAEHERASDVENALIEGGRAVLVRDLSHALDTANALAPEHLALVFPGALDALDRVTNAGAVFVGASSPVSVGDYVAGTNHILPSGGSARWASGLGVSDFLTRTYVSGLEPSALERLAPHVTAMSASEGLPAHGRAVDIRLDRRGGVA